MFSLLCVNAHLGVSIGALRKIPSRARNTLAGIVELWIPDRSDSNALGELPAGVELYLIPKDGPAAELLEAEFLVPGSDQPFLLEALGGMEKLSVIQTLSAGVDWLLPFLPPGVTLCDARGTRDLPVAEWVLGAILAQAKHLGEARDSQRAHVWQWREPEELAGKTVMILGYGSIGVAVERLLETFQAQVIRVARHARSGVHAVEELASLIGLADVVVVLLPLTEATEGLLDRGMLGRMREGALLVNAARGPIVDSEALLEQLQAGRLRAALDVTEPEPLPAEHPLWDAPGLLLTPHFAGDTRGAEERALALVGEQVRRYMRGEALVNVVEGDY
jgi:phosphoglycerate dehydrogenase-like enzyme